MKGVYPVLLTQGKEMIVVSVPDFGVNTQGKDVAEAMEMARDVIGVMGIDMQDDGEALPAATALCDVVKEHEDDMLTLVDVDFDEYRRKNDLRSVKKNCTIPSWLNFEAEKAGLNFSNLLADAIKRALGLSDLPSYN